MRWIRENIIDPFVMVVLILALTSKGVLGSLFGGRGK